MQKAMFRLLLMTFTMVTYAVQAQKTCGFDNLHKQLLKKDPQYKKKVEDGETIIKQKILEKSLLSKVAAQLYRIPVVVHVIHNGEAVGTGANISDAQINSAITSLSQYFRASLGNSVDADIEFVLASRNPNCNTTNGIVRVDGSGVANYSTSGIIPSGGSSNEVAVKNLSRWPTSEYYNIWVVSEIDNNNGGAGIQGYAYFPGASSQVDGTVILYNAFGYDPTGAIGYNLKSYTRRNTVLTHELGHAFGLYHSFEGDDSNNDGIADTCPPNNAGTCTNDGDRVCDTEPHQRSASNCTVGINSCTSASNANIIRNYMDYSSETCQDRFTAGQVSRMRAFIDFYRPSLINSHGMNAAYPINPYISPVAASCLPNTSATGLSNNYAGIMNVSVGNKTFTSSTSANDNGFLNNSSNCLNLVPLVAGNNYTFSATVLGVNNEQLRAWIDFNNDGIFDNATESIHFSNFIPHNFPTGYVTVSGNFPVPESAVLNTVLRMRVMDDLNAIANACHNPQYGQAEDYSVYISPSTLQVTLFDFSGQLVANTIQLKWNTLNEQNAVRFEVEKSMDGINYKSIGQVKAIGNSNKTHDYFFTDPNPLALNMYRLKIVAQDNTEISKVITIRNNNIQQQLNILTNPFSSFIELKLDKSANIIKLQLINTSGSILIEEEIKQLNGQYTWHLKKGNFAPGIYILRANIDGNWHHQKLIKK